MDSARWSNVGKLRRDYETGRERLFGLPLEAFIEVSGRCNLRCPMCAIGFDQRYQTKQGRPGLLSPEVFSELRPLFPTLLRAHLYGLGEPLLNRHLAEFVGELSAAGVHTRTTSNGTLMTAERAEELARAGLDRISLSIDGATAATYEAIRRGARFSDVRRALTALADARRHHGRPQVTVNFVAMASNFEELPHLVELAAEAGVEEMNVEPLFDWGASEPELREVYERENLSRLEGRVDPGAILAEASRLAEDAAISFSSRLLTDHGSWDYKERVAEARGPRWVCSEPFTTIAVTTAGEVRTCCLNDTCFGHLNGDGQRTGDAPTNHRSILGIWNGTELARFRRRHLELAGATSGRSPRNGGPEPSADGHPTGCESCLANGRMRHSPLLASVEPVSYRPILSTPEPSARVGFAVDGPRAGETVTDPLILTGRIPPWLALAGHHARLTLSRVQLLVDRTPVATLDRAARRRRRFALEVPVPYLTEGTHVLSLRMVDDEHSPGWCRRTVHFRRPELSNGARPVTRETVVRLLLAHPTRRPFVWIGGIRWDWVRWYLNREAGAWWGTALLDLKPLPLGRHHVVVQAAGHPAVDLWIERLSEV